MRQVLGFFGGMIALALRGLRRQPRSRLALVGAALCLLALTGSILLALDRGASPSTLATDPAAANRVLPTATATLTATATATKTKTPQAPAPTSKVSNTIVTLPPPPPVPTGSSAPPPTATPCPTATPYPTTTNPGAGPSPNPTPTDTSTDTPTNTSAFVGGHLLAMPANCAPPCGTTVQPDQQQADAIQQDLTDAANAYGLPPKLLYAVAYQESQWDPNAMSCDGGIGLMQVQYYTYGYINNLNSDGCDGIALSTTKYDPYTAQGSADLGAKYLRFLKCYFEYDTPDGGTATNLYSNSSASDYYNAGLQYPDLKTRSGTALADCPTGAATPSPTPQAGKCRFCQTLLDDNINGPAPTTYADLDDPAGVNAHWSCPYDPTQGITSNEVLDFVLSAYNEGPTAVFDQEVIDHEPAQNLNTYVGPVEYWVTTQPWSAWL